MAAKKRQLTTESRAFIVQQIACYATPTETADLVNQEFGLDITPQNVEKYDPTKYSGRRCAKKWKVLFHATREAFDEHMEAYVPYAKKSVRVRELSNAAAAFKRAKNWVGMADMLERIAKECGNVHTNRRELTGKGGGPVKFQDVDMMDEGAVDEELADLRAKYGSDVHKAPAKTQ